MSSEGSCICSVCGEEAKGETCIPEDSGDAERRISKLSIMTSSTFFRRACTLKFTFCIDCNFTLVTYDFTLNSNSVLKTRNFHLMDWKKKILYLIIVPKGHVTNSIYWLLNEPPKTSPPIPLRNTRQRINHIYSR